VREHLAGDHLLCSRMLLGWPVTPPPPAREKSRWLVDCNPRIHQQHLGRLLCRARHGGIVAHEVARDRAVDQKLKLCRKPVRTGDAEFDQLCETRAFGFP